ncbi:MAG: type II secretion system protein GspL, partial [Pseudomonadales bacterium]
MALRSIFGRAPLNKSGQKKFAAKSDHDSMPDLLCLRFRESHIGADKPVAWALLSAGGLVESSGHTLLRDLPEVFAGSESVRRCVVIVGSENILLSRVEVPAKQQRHLRQLVPFLVEEQIVDPIEAMHLAMPVLHSGEQVSVAAIRRSLLEEWLDNLFDAGIAPDYLFLDVLCVPRKQGDWQLLFDGSRLLFRDGPCSGMVLAPQTANTVLHLALSAMPEGNQEAVNDALEEIDAAEAGSSDIINRAAQRAERDAMAAAASAKVILIDSENAASEHAALAGLTVPVDAGENAVHREPKAPRGAAAAAQDVPHDPHEAALLGEDYVNPGDLAGTSAAGGSEPVSESVETGPENWLQQIDTLVRSENVTTARLRYSETVSELLAISAAQNLDSGLNLLQGDFRPATANAAQRRFLRKISAAVAACVALFLVITLGGGAYLNYRGDKNFDKSVA